MIEVKMSKRRLERYKRADRVCRQLRYIIGSRHCDITQADWNRLFELNLQWMAKAGKDKYEKP